jgi:UDPglucose 6-dehydrogenase
VVTTPTTAELIKHAANAFLSTKISFINMVADICEAVGADVESVARGIGLDPRIGTQFLSAGIGFGGYCFPKDLRAFLLLGEEHGTDTSLLREVERINLSRIELFMAKVRKALWVVSGKSIAVLGLAFKPRTDDIREAPSLKVIDCLLREGASVRLYDPEAMANTRRELPAQPGRVTYCQSAYEAAEGAHAVVVLTEWDEFRKLDLKKLRRALAVPVMVDGRNLYPPDQVHKAGLEYVSMGRPGTDPVVRPISPARGAERRRMPAIAANS